jgi:rubrerythrin
MTPDRDQSEPPVDGNKNETEIPVGDATDAEARDASMWQCGECGELRDLDADLPAACPACGAPREELYYRVED